MKKSITILLIISSFIIINSSSATENYWQQYVHYNFNVRLNVEKHNLSGDVIITYKNNSPDTLDRIYLHLYPNAFKNENSTLAREAKNFNYHRRITPQNNGYIEVNSTPGQGSTFRLYFPQVQIEDNLTVQPDQKLLVKGKETILVVEDEASLLDIAIAMLTEAGYRVLSAQGPFAAIQLAEKNKEPIHLLLTDIVMPKMNGVELSEYLIKIKPEMKKLYMSGYPKEHFNQLRQHDTTTQLLKKPFSAYQLTKMVREALDVI